MNGNYYRNLKGISLSQYEKELEQTELLPSRRVIREDIGNRFARLEKLGIRNLDDLISAVKTAEKLKKLAVSAGLPEQYLAVLKREILSYMPKPVKLSNFPSVDSDAVKKLEKIGISSARQLFEFVQTQEDREKLSGKTGIPYRIILELAKLTDVSRIQWVGANFARLLVDSGCDTADKVAGSDYRELYPVLMKTGENKAYFKGKFGPNDIKLCVQAAKLVPASIQFE